MSPYCECGAYIMSREDGTTAEPHNAGCRWGLFDALMREYAHA